MEKKAVIRADTDQDTSTSHRQTMTQCIRIQMQLYFNSLIDTDAPLRIHTPEKSTKIITAQIVMQPWYPAQPINGLSGLQSIST